MKTLTKEMQAAITPEIAASRTQGQIPGFPFFINENADG